MLEGVLSWAHVGLSNCTKQVFRLPDTLTLESAAGVLAVFLTAYHAFRLAGIDYSGTKVCVCCSTQSTPSGA